MEEALAWLFDQGAPIVFLVGLIFSIWRGWLVPGPYHQREVERGNALRDTNAIQAEALNKATDGLELVIDVVRGIDEQVRGRP